ncbi:ribosome small subunit-dependent GTPase A [Gallaecimonas sp. GXIMD1310]|uniref:ribosome small subunit-dependent GTPase A n=1 Tax=Gallaecimonas sp. GXIMD1310 TaxID=3131926 RepID=UPI003243FB43
MEPTLQALGLVPFFSQQLADASEEQCLGRVTAVQRASLNVACADGEKSAALSAALQQAPAAQRPTVGDWVVLDNSATLVKRVLQRKGLFKRVGAGQHSDLQAIAANVDILFIVTSCNDEFKASRLERYLALAAEAGAMPVVVLTKADLTGNAEHYAELARACQPGLAVETVNALDPSSLSGLRAWLDRTATVALVGSSGVGKSTLLNTLAGQPLTATGGIREQDAKGRHTTTHRQLHPLPGGGLLIDVPGMRELRVADVEQSLSTVFADIEELASHCKFTDCQHHGEPGCAVQKAIANGELDYRRLANYQKLHRENAQANASLAQKRAQGRTFAKMVKAVKRNKATYQDE